MAGRQSKSSSELVAVCKDCKKEAAERKPRRNRSVLLEIAAADGHVNCVDAILKAGANVNCVNSENEHTPLVWAVRHRKDRCVELLIKAGADVNFADSKDTTALMLASSHGGNIKSVELLLEAGADVNRCNNRGDTALMFAASSGRNDKVTLLIKAGANVNAVSNNGDTAANNFAVSRGGDWKCVDTLAKAGADLNFMTNDKTPLMWAVDKDREKNAEMLMKAGADVNKVDDDGANVLHWAAGRSKEFYRMFIEAGVDVNAKMSDICGGETPLMQCLDNSPSDCAEMLIEAGADVNITRYGNLPTALFYANDTDSVKLLLRSRARINVKNNRGLNALERRLDWMFRWGGGVMKG